METVSLGALRWNWARLIQRVYEVDPKFLLMPKLHMTCPKCGH